VGLTRAELARARNGLDLKTGAADPRSYEYRSGYACPFNTLGGLDSLCSSAVAACAGNTPAQGLGPLIRLYRRELSANGLPAAGWQIVGTTCLVDLVPGKPVLGLGQILAAFHNTPWSRPTVHIQPEGNLTLVTLPTYFAVVWPEAGYEPGESDTVTLLGQQVKIRPTLDHYSYVFGDGTTSDSTTSAGGPYPSGDIIHTYPTAGVYNTHIDVTFGGEFSISGGTWVPIPDTVTIAGPLQPLMVKRAHARLVIR
ncbi:MAG: hypothetical protein ABI934_09075, partial [Actinomycetota bacterium]